MSHKQRKMTAGLESMLRQQQRTSEKRCTVCGRKRRSKKHDEGQHHLKALEN